jgi:predicted cupin superfamily sugar epimerase
MHPDVSALIEYYSLKPLPIEGTLFTSTYRSRQEMPDGNPLGTAMIGLYADDPVSFSCFHRLPTDEIWHFYGGDPLRLVVLYADGSSEEVVMGSDPFIGQRVQFIVPANAWQAGHMIRGGRYSLFGCTMAPGFTSDGFEAGIVADLIELYPDCVDDIQRLCVTGHETRMPDGFAV